ncbi:MAG TPA: tripartite tricarboxylate transporter TctB family protein [Candidatus Avidesulfovibrio excrementigallinarum]|nr:tripartite tricarboxylate transporter TctB family protein [Candidatus Avidesulfovibrio excrementigallinarum]
MSALRREFYLGLVLSALFAITLFVLIPLGISNPMAHDPSSILPRTYPTWIMAVCLGLALALTGNAFWRLRRAASQPAETPDDAPAPLRRAQVLRSLLCFALLLGCWFYIEEIGMILGSFLLYAAFSLLCGERNIARLLIIDVILTSLLYAFFVRIMGAPIPLGPLTGIL